MKKTKIFYGNQYAGSFHVGKTRMQSFLISLRIFVKRTTLVLSGICAMGWSVYAGSQFIPRTIYAEKAVPVTESLSIPVLDRIIACESKTSQNNKNGQVAIHVNSDGSYDIGIMQINSVWDATATKLGFDLSNEKDNLSFGKYLFLQHGSEPWYSSKACWNK